MVWDLHFEEINSKVPRAHEARRQRWHCGRDAASALFELARMGFVRMAFGASFASLRLVAAKLLCTDRIQTTDVLNMIPVFDKDQFWITGKYWPNLQLVEFV
jgi:hypothetical protein